MHFLPFSPCGRRWRASKSRRMRGLYPRSTDPSPASQFVSHATFSHKGRGEEPTRALIAPQLRHPAPDRRRAGPAVPHARGQQRRGAGGAARRRQDHAGAAGAAGCAVAEGQEDHHAGAAPDRGPRQRRAHGEDAGRTRRRNRRLPRPVRLQSVARDQNRGRHRGHFFAADPRRSRTVRRRRGAVRRISRALARCRSRPGAGARRANRPARGSAHSRDVGDAGWRAGRQDCSAMRR